MRRAAAALAGAAAVLLSGCGGDEPGTIATPAPRTTGTIVPPEPASTASRETTPQPVPALKPPPSVPRSRRAYLQRLDALAGDLGAAIDEAAKSGESAAIAAVDEQILRTTKAWLASGGAPSPAAVALAAAIATARSNVETPLLLDESRRQLRAALTAVAQELASA
ncbi:MAG: hypothetical protein JWO02_2911 [Solirubrobacterales bacterium]|nr:hypothetical protein [Solirubrobacterales bacterium]